MAAGAEKIGLDAVMNTTQFKTGMAEYMSGLTKMNQATQQASTQQAASNKEAEKGAGIFGQLAGMLGMSTGTMLGLGAAIGVGVGAFKLISSAVGGFVDFMFKGEESAIMVASRVEQLNLIAQTLAQNQGFTGEAVNELVGALNKEGVSLNVANYLVAQFSRMNLDLARSTELARVAQDAATISNEGSSDALEGLIYGIQTLNIRILRTHGILVDTDKAYATYAATLGKTANDLSTAEKQQAMLNEVIAQGATIAGAYQASMMTAGKQLGSMTSRILPDLKAALGAPFQGAFYNLVKGFNDVLEGIRKMVTEGGVLYPFMVQLGAIFQVVTDPIRAMGAALKDTQDGPIAGFITGIADMVGRMAQWGFDLISNFAIGIINAAQTVLITAINYVGNLLTAWFAPGSPPMILPEIDSWGAETMEEYLKGFTEADFNILDAIQGRMKDVFGSLSEMGQISKEAASTMWSQFSEKFIQAISAGELTNALLDEIKSAGGMYGEQLAKMAQEQFAVAQALKATKAAEDALTAAKLRASNAGVKVNKGIMEYNQMLRSGASKEALQAKLDEINASKAEQSTAEQGVKTAEDNVKAANDNLDVLREQAALTEKVLQNMIELNRAQVEAAKAREEALPKATAPAAGAGAGAGAPDLSGLGAGLAGGFDPNKIVNPMRDAINTAAAKIKERIGILFSDIVFAWDSLVRNVKIAWEKSGIPKMWEESGLGEYFQKLKPVWDAVVKVFKGIWISVIGEVVAAFKIAFATVAMVVKVAIDLVIGIVKIFVNFFKGDLDAAADAMGTMFTRIWESIKTWLIAIFNAVKEWFMKVYDWLIGNSWITDVLNGFLAFFANFIAAVTNWVTGIWNTITTIFGAVRDWLAGVWDAISAKVTEIWNAISAWVTTKITEVQTTLSSIGTAISTAWTTFWDGVSQKATDIWNAISTWVTTKITEVKTTIDSIAAAITLAWGTFWDGLKTKADEIWKAIVEAVTTKVDEVRNLITGIFEGATGIFGKIAGWVQSFTQMGADMLGGLWSGISGAIAQTIANITGAVQSIIDAVLRMLGIASPSKVFEELGLATMQGMEIGIRANSNLPKRAMANAAVQTVGAAAVPITTGATNYYQPSISINNQINGGIQAAQLEALILRTVKKGMTA